LTFYHLDRPVQFCKGVGPKRAESLGRMGILTARDLLYHVPRRYDDASTVEPIGRLEVGMDATIVGRIRTKGVIPTRRGLRIFQAVLQDDSGMITSSWPGQPWLERKLKEGDLLLVSGPVKHFHGRQIQPREFTVLARAADEVEFGGHIFVTYPASEHVPQWVLRGLFEKNLDTLLEQSSDEEYLGRSELEGLGLPGLRSALESMHRPASTLEVQLARRRLAYDELFFLQVMQAQVRYQETVARPGIAFARTNELLRALHERLEFELTGAQAAVLRDITSDMISTRRMNRLLQGDVGSGKTVVAVFAMLLALEGGYQAALMVPTEILAEQHHRKLLDWLTPLGLEVVLLTGRMSASARRDALEKIKSGTAQITVGTHALIQEGVDFHKLGLVVVDEQHRFGVRQRMALGDRAKQADTLVMSATPIPRSLALALHGDLDLSILDELPPGRKPIRTVLRYPKKRDEVYGFVASELAAGRQAYIVYPLVEESEKVDLKAATEEHKHLQEEVFSDRTVGLLHGKLKSAEKDAVMRAFADGDIDVLVATTVIEVGIDVSNATVMLIEHAERFGLSQLHQLRGRVGRGAEDSYCILIAEPGQDAAERLKIFRDTSDGFEIANADLKIRGQGDLFGSQQHGKDVLLRFADLLLDEDLLVEAQRRAREAVERDPELEAPEHEKVSELLEHRYADHLKLFRVG
jgi:ATP-dependent DNA helicase RecG